MMMTKIFNLWNPFYKNTNGTYEYDFFFSETPEYVWGPDWDIDTPSSNGDLTPEESTYSEIKRVITTLPLKTLEETSCYSMEYATYGILALAWIDIENLEEYPENGRMTLKFGFSKDKVESLLDSQSWKFEN